MIRFAHAALAAALAAAGCQGEIGTIQIALVIAPGSTVLDPVTTLRATLSSPLRTVMAERGPDGFSLAIEVTADGRGAVVILEGLDAGGNVVAVGSTPPLPLVALDAEVAVYMAAPQSLAAAPVALDPPRSEIGSALLEYGVLLAGGRSAAGPTADLDIYNAYTHTFTPGQDLPGPRRGLAAGYSPSGYAYLFGGADAADQPSGIVWRFNTSIEPDGEYLELDNDPTLARVGQIAAPLGLENFLITGEPPVILSGFTGLEAAPLGLLLPPVAVSVQNTQVPDAPVFTVIVGEGAGATGIVVYVEGIASDLTAPSEAQRTRHGAAPTPDEEVIVVGGGTGVDGPLTSALETTPRSPATARSSSSPAAPTRATSCSATPSSSTSAR
jgi:hypothetical protein